MATKQETIILNDFGSVMSKLRRRTTSRGTKSRVTLEIKSEPLVHVFDDVALGSGPANAIRDVLERSIKAIGQMSALETRKRRARAQIDFRTNPGGSKWLKKRYSGGRIGPKEPNQTFRLFNDSGRLAEGLFVRQNPREATFTVNVPANRFTDATRHLIPQLISLATSFGSPEKILADKAVQKEIRDSIGLILKKARSSRDAKRVLQAQRELNRAKTLRSAQIRVAKALLTLGKTLLK